MKNFLIKLGLLALHGEVITGCNWYKRSGSEEWIRDAEAGAEDVRRAGR